MANKQPTGYIIYRGPSLLDGSPIVVVALTHSGNRKTGDMVQTYILADGPNPVEAARSGADAAVCGDCKHRPANGGACYVTLIHGPSSVWRGLQRGIYPVLDGADGATVAECLSALGAGRMVRLGTYGDPAAVPAWIWQALVAQAEGRTGYTHQWANGDLSEDYQLRPLRALVMASCDTEQEAQYAQQLGWRYFRVRGSLEEPRMVREMVCPASEEAGKVRTCASCGACDGAQRGPSKASVVIVVHGSKASRFAQRSA